MAIKKKILILIVAHVVGLSGVRYFHANGLPWMQVSSEEKAARLGEANWGVIRVPVANFNESERFSASAVTQGLMGMPVRLLQQDGWYEAQLPDGYTGWIHASQIRRMTAKELGEWNERPKLVVTSLSTSVRAVTSDEMVTVLPAGAHVVQVRSLANDWIVELPDGRQGRIARDDVENLKDFQLKNVAARQAADFGQRLITKAMHLKGVSYQWGGTSTAAMDCSGFIKTVFWMHDMILPRDASQQAYIGERFDDKTLARSGDLYFFGSAGKDHRARISHVAMALGDDRFIHSLGDVHTASFNEKDVDYDAYETRRYLWSVRLDVSRSSPCWQTSSENGFYQNPPQPLAVCKLR